MMRSLCMTLLTMFFLAACTKEKRFENGIQGKWSIESVLNYSVYSVDCGGQGATLLSSQENAGTIELTNEKYPTKVAYSTTDQQYIGRWTDQNGNESEFVYEFFEKLYGGFSLTFFMGGPNNVAIEILTRKDWKFSTNTYNGGCAYNWIKYELSKK